MSSLAQKSSPANSATQRGVRKLILGRLIVMSLLFVTAWIWYSGPFQPSGDHLTNGIFLGLVASAAVTAVYLLMLSLFRDASWQIKLQFFVDALLVTWLVWQTGGLTSPYITVYIVLIAVSSIYLRPRPTLLMAVLSVILFSTLGIATATGWVFSEEGPTEISRAFQIISFHTVAFLVVGLLASRLSERRSSGEQLAETTKSLANLRALHERIIESIRSGLITTDLEGNIFTFNKAAREITGFQAAAVEGTGVSRLIPNFDSSIETVASSPEGEHALRFEADLFTPQGFAVHIGYSVSKLLSETNELTGWIITFQDLTEIRSMEESVRRKDRLAAVGRVGAGLAHEIRNPLGAMRGAIQVLQSATPPESMQADLMGIILRESDRLNSIITNFLSYAKPKVGNFGEVDVCEAIRDTATLLRHSPDITAAHHIEEVLPAAPIFVSADTTQLKQIFWNLARNAVQAMPEGGKLFVRVEPRTAGRIRIIFEDNGSGMPPEQVEQLFEPFAKSTSGGTGLGLSIVYQIIRDHNGTINVRSIQGEGTIITVELPRQQRTETIANPAAGESNRLSDFLNVKEK